MTKNDTTATEFQNTKNNLLKQLMQHADSLIDDLENNLARILPTEPMQSMDNVVGQQAQPIMAQPVGQQHSNRSLPWFRHGVRGFLRKLWQGDSSTNPDWGNYADSILSKSTIQEYIAAESYVNNEINILLSEAGFNDAKSYFNKFKKDLFKAIQYYTKELYAISYQRGYQDAEATIANKIDDISKPEDLDDASEPDTLAARVQQLQSDLESSKSEHPIHPMANQEWEPHP